MRIFSYRNKRALRRALLIALLAVVLIGLLILARISYLGRYAVYSPDGVYFDKTQKLQREDVPAAAPAADPEEYPFETILSASSGEEETGPDTVQLQGYYISTTMLANGVDEVRQALQAADGYNAVLIDVKSPLGNFYYSTDIADAQTADADISACDALIRELTETPDLIVVARVPAFSDPNFVAKHYSSALTTTSGDLWMDERRCYWLRPDSIDAQSYLAAIALELDSLGFDEVLFDNFYVPSDSSIAWDTEAITPVAALEDCAENLTANLTGSSIRLALGTNVPSVAQYASRVFVTTERANDVLSVTDAMTEDLPVISRLLEADAKSLDRLQIQMATAREFFILVRLREETGMELHTHLSRIQKSLEDQGFKASLASGEDLKRMLGVYFEQNATTEKYEDYDGERWIILND